MERQQVVRYCFSNHCRRNMNQSENGGEAGYLPNRMRHQMKVSRWCPTGFLPYYRWCEEETFRISRSLRTYSVVYLASRVCNTTLLHMLYIEHNLASRSYGVVIYYMSYPRVHVYMYGLHATNQSVSCWYSATCDMLTTDRKSVV